MGENEEIGGLNFSHCFHTRARGVHFSAFCDFGVVSSYIIYSCKRICPFLQIIYLSIYQYLITCACQTLIYSLLLSNLQANIAVFVKDLSYFVKN